MTDKTPWAAAPAAMIHKKVEGAWLDEQRRIIREAIRQRVRTNTFRTADGFTLRRVPADRLSGHVGEFIWTDGDLFFDDYQGSPIKHITEAGGASGEIILAGEFLPDEPKE